MACGCGGGCCHDNPVQRAATGLGFLSWDGGESGGGFGDTWEGDWFLGGDGSGGDWGGYYPWDYGFYEPDSYYDPSTDTFVFPGNDAPFLPTGQQGSDGTDWLANLWNALSGALGSGGNDTNSGSGSNPPPILPYCPGGTYHPRSNPYACVPFPPETPEFEKQQKAAAAHKAAQDALKAAAAKAQQQQGCPPNTGLVKNQAGQCACPPPLAFSKSAGKCVLASQLTAADKKDLQAPDWLTWAILAGVIVLVVRR